MGMLLTFFLGFFFVEVVGYFLHRLLHTKWMGSLHRAHMTHHLKLYPPEDYLSDKYRDAGADSATYSFIVAGVLVAIPFFWLAPPWFAIPIAIDMAVFGWLNNYIHDSTHIRGHRWERLKLYQRWRSIHYIHHVDMSKNFGVVTFLTDRVMKTYRKPQSL